MLTADQCPVLLLKMWRNKPFKRFTLTFIYFYGLLSPQVCALCLCYVLLLYACVSCCLPCVLLFVLSSVLSTLTICLWQIIATSLQMSCSTLSELEAIVTFLLSHACLFFFFLHLSLNWLRILSQYLMVDVLSFLTITPRS